MIDDDDEVGGDEVNLDFEFSLLQINDFPNVKLKIDALFYDWLLSGLSDGAPSLLAELKQSLANYQKDNSKININEISALSINKSNQSSTNESSAAEHVSSNPSTVVPAASIYFAPPLSPNRKSPKKRLQSEMMIKNNSDASGIDHLYDSQGIILSPAPLPKSFNDKNENVSRNNDDEDEKAISLATSRRRSNFDTIPVFYIPGDRTKSRKSSHIRDEDSLVAKLPEIEAFFKPFKDGIPVDKFVHVTKRLCCFPSYFNVPFCERIFELYAPPESLSSTNKSSFTVNTQNANKITMKIFLQYWKNEMEPYDVHERFFRLIKQPNEDYIHQDDFLPFLHELLRFHPGLDFLDGHEEFQRKYALTVITRIFFKVNTSRTGKLSIREVRKAKLLHDFIHVDEETEINRVKEYFAYEHFYVLYCRFFELDVDKDSKLQREDLIKYSDHSLSEAIVDRVFQVGQRAFTDGKEGFDQTGGMTYPDFIYFMLAEEDKACEQSLKYWFRCCDLDGDGVITPAEMGHFYKTQIHRLTSLGQESIQFRDVLCQMLDMLNPVSATALTLRDFTVPDKRKAGGIIFDVLFNLNKFLRFEMRDPFQEKLRREDGFACEWDRFAHFEYHRLAAEDDVNSQGQQQAHAQQEQYGYANNRNSNVGNSHSNGNINVVINGVDSEDDYNMFSEDDSVDNPTSSVSNMMDLDNSLDVSHRGYYSGVQSNYSLGGNSSRNSNSNVAQKGNANSFGDWSLDDESDGEDDYQSVSRGNYAGATSKYTNSSSNSIKANSYGKRK